MTTEPLIEYLQSAATELREMACHRRLVAGIGRMSLPLHTIMVCDYEVALADHVEKMLTLHTVATEDEFNPDGPRTYCEGCWWILEDADDACPSLQSLADLVATVTGNPIPEGAQTS